MIDVDYPLRATPCISGGEYQGWFFPILYSSATAGFDHRDLSAASDLHQDIIKGRPRAQIRQPLRCHIIRIAAIAGQLLPPNRQCDDHTWPGLVGHAGFELELTAVVEDSHQVAIFDVAGGCVCRMDVQ